MCNLCSNYLLEADTAFDSRFADKVCAVFVTTTKYSFCFQISKQGLCSLCSNCFLKAITAFARRYPDKACASLCSNYFLKTFQISKRGLCSLCSNCFLKTVLPSRFPNKACAVFVLNSFLQQIQIWLTDFQTRFVQSLFRILS